MMSCDVIAMSCDVIVMSCDVTAMSCDVIVMSCDVTAMSCDVLAHDVISCRFMEDHSTSSLIWNYKVVYRVLQTCSEFPSLISYIES